MMADHRVNVNFSESAYQALDEIARAKGVPKAEALRDAIALAKWVLDTKKEGGRILADRNGDIRELVLL